MSRAEFIEKLQRALAGGLNSSQVAENVRYYREYIDCEVSKGRREGEVKVTLGMRHRRGGSGSCCNCLWNLPFLYP